MNQPPLSIADLLALLAAYAAGNADNSLSARDLLAIRDTVLDRGMACEVPPMVTVRGEVSPAQMQRLRDMSLHNQLVLFSATPDPSTETP